jgi:hypothetical protein
MVPHPISRRVVGIWSICFLRSVSCVWFDEREIRQTRASDRLPLNHHPLTQRSLPLQSDGYAIDFAVDSRITVC